MIRIKQTLFFFVVAGLVVGLSSAYAVTNLLKNGNFEDGVPDPWTTYGAATLEITTADKVEGTSALEVTVDEKGANFWDAGLQHDPANHVFESGKKYTLSAFLKSPDGLGINFKPELSEDPFTGYGEQQFVMTNDWTEYHTTTDVMTEDVAPATITFHIAFDAGVFFIDDVKFYEGDYVPTGITSVQSKGKLATTWARLKAGK